MRPCLYDKLGLQPASMFGVRILDAVDNRCDAGEDPQEDQFWRLKMTLQLDARVGGARQQFSTQIPPGYCQAIIDAGFVGTDCPDFYEGLLAGYANSLAILQQMPLENAKDLIGSCVATLAKRL